MKNKIVSGIVLTLLLIGMLTLTFNIQPVRASGTIYIRADGSVEGTIDISSADNVTYTFTDNNYDEVVVQRSNIIIDGNGYILQGTEAPGSRGIILSGRSNVTVKNLKITLFDFGVYLWGSSNNSIVGNNITSGFGGVLLLGSSNNNTVSGNNMTWGNNGVYLHLSSNNTVSENNVTDSENGVLLLGSYNNTVSGNIITDNSFNGVGLADSSNNSIVGNNITNMYHGVYLLSSSNNTLSENNVTDNYFRIVLIESNDNTIFHNNFVDNWSQVSIESSDSTWDDGYPSGGNYWSDYTTRYPDAQELDDSGIWNTPYVIDDFNQDNYPLMGPWTPPEVPPVEDTEAYIEYVNQTIQDLPDEIFTKPEEDVPDVKNDFSILLNDTRENINEGNYERAIEKLNRIKEKTYEEMVESAEREEIISMIDNLIAYLESLL